MIVKEFSKTISYFGFTSEVKTIIKYNCFRLFGFNLYKNYTIKQYYSDIKNPVLDGEYRFNKLIEIELKSQYNTADIWIREQKKTSAK